MIDDSTEIKQNRRDPLIEKYSKTAYAKEKYQYTNKCFCGVLFIWGTGCSMFVFTNFSNK